MEHRRVFLHGSILNVPHRVVDIRGGGSVGDPAERPIVAIGRRPFPYSAGFVVSGPSGLGSINSLFGASTNAFGASNPSPTKFNEYEHNFDFTGGSPLTLFAAGAPGRGQLTIYNASVSGLTATILAVPELSTWAMMAFGVAGLGMAGRLRGWRPESRLATE